MFDLNHPSNMVAVAPQQQQEHQQALCSMQY
jgi:hypothetical protein